LAQLDDKYTLLKNISHYLVFLERKKTLYLFKEPVIYLPLHCKQAEMLQTARGTSLTIVVGGVMRFD